MCHLSDSIHKDRKEGNGTFNGKFDNLKVILNSQTTLPKMSNLDYSTNYSFHHVICDQ